MELRDKAVTPHVAQSQSGRRSAIDSRTPATLEVGRPVWTRRKRLVGVLVRSPVLWTAWCKPVQEEDFTEAVGSELFDCAFAPVVVTSEARLLPSGAIARSRLG
jgi:hypothetical protein